jgi:alanine dehydrogenase
MKIGLIKETKIPEDNRVALTPSQVRRLSQEFPNIQFKVQSSKIRAYSDNEYLSEGVEVVESVSDCDFLIGVKEASIATLLPHKHYMFFGHMAKRQVYNKPLFKNLIDLGITFSDYEYLFDKHGGRMDAFSWFAGIVGTYYTLLGWGKKTKLFNLAKPESSSTVENLIDNVKSLHIQHLKIVVTGAGRVSKGTQYFLNHIEAKCLNPDQFLKVQDSDFSGIIYCVLPKKELVARAEDGTFDTQDFAKYPDRYHSLFKPYTSKADMLICCHYWTEGQPVFLSVNDYLAPGFRIGIIGDITCDIKGSIKSTIRSSTHASPFYDYNPVTRNEEEPFTDSKNVTVMAVDTCPNALPRIASQAFGEQLIDVVLREVLEAGIDKTDVLDHATILREGILTDDFKYLTDYVQSFD